MKEFVVRTPGQLSGLLRGYRNERGLTQAEAALRLGVTQQTLSALERNADKVSSERLMKLLAILGVELVLRETQSETVALGAVARRTGGKDNW
jgi:HTH-type transcriptional regulator / antitoxin HipB